MKMRNRLDEPEYERTTIMADKKLLSAVSAHVKENGESQGDFIMRALVNQLEREGKFGIRFDLEDNNVGVERAI